jgi:hypothetical protein
MVAGMVGGSSARWTVYGVGGTFNMTIAIRTMKKMKKAQTTTGPAEWPK